MIMRCFVLAALLLLAEGSFSCAPGQYFHPVSSTCLSCQPNCQACLSGSSCQKCLSTFYL
jgi:hypothetical protein